MHNGETMEKNEEEIPAYGGIDRLPGGTLEARARARLLIIIEEHVAALLHGRALITPVVAGGKTVAEMTVRVAALRTVRVVPVVQRSHEKIRQRTEDRPRRAHREEQPLGAGGRERRRPGSLAGTPQDFADGHDHLPRAGSYHIRRHRYEYR